MRQYPRFWQSESYDHGEGDDSDESMLTLNLRRSFFVSEAPCRDTDLKLLNSTPVKPQEHAPVTMWLCSGAPDSATGKGLTSGLGTSGKRVCNPRAPPGSADSGRAPTAIGKLRPTPAEPYQRRAGTSGPCPQQTQRSSQNDRVSFFRVELWLTGSIHLTVQDIKIVLCNLKTGHHATHATFFTFEDSHRLKVKQRMCPVKN